MGLCASGLDHEADHQPEDELQKAIRQEFEAEHGIDARRPLPAGHGSKHAHQQHLQPPLWHKHDLSTCEEEQRSAEVVQSRELHYMHTPGPAGRTIHAENSSHPKQHRSSGSIDKHQLYNGGASGGKDVTPKKSSPPRTHAQWSLDSAELASATLPYSHNGHHLRNGARSSSGTMATTSRESSLTKIKTLPSASSSGGNGSAATSGSYNQRPLLTQVSPTHAQKQLGHHSASTPSLKQNEAALQLALDTKRSRNSLTIAQRIVDHDQSPQQRSLESQQATEEFTSDSQSISSSHSARNRMQHQTMASRFQSSTVDSPRLHHRSQSSSPGPGGRKRVAYTSLRAAAAAGAAAQAHAAQVAAATSGIPLTPTRSGQHAFSFATAPSSDPSAANNSGSRRNSRDSNGRIQSPAWTHNQLPRQLSFGQRTMSEDGASGAPHLASISSTVGSGAVAAIPDNAAAASASNTLGTPVGRTRMLPALSINTSALSSSSVAPATTSAPSAALVASYGTKSSIAAFKRAYAAKLAETQQQQQQPQQPKQARPSSSSKVAPQDQAEEKQQQPGTTSIPEPTSAVGDGISSPGGIVLAEGDGPLPSPANYGRVQPAHTIAAPDSGRSNSTRLQQQQQAAAAPTSAIANGMGFLDPDSARNSKTHGRSRSRGYNPSAALQAHAAAVAAGSSAASSAAVTPASIATAAPATASTDSARRPTIDRAVSVNSVVRQEQIQLLRSSLNAQQQEQQREKAARTPAAHTPGALSPPHSHSRNPSTGGALFMGASSDPSADVSMLMTPENILNETNPMWHEHYKQWFREEIAAERAEAKRRIKEAADNGGRHYSPSRSLFTPERDLMFVTDDTDLHALGCRTPGTPQMQGGVRQCFTPGGTLLNLLVESNSRSATPAGGNTPGWLTPGGPGSPVAAWRLRQAAQQQGETKSPSHHHAPITISTSAAHTPNRGPVGGASAAQAGGGAGSGGGHAHRRSPSVPVTDGMVGGS